MRIVISEFISLDGVVQAPGGANEDTDIAFVHAPLTHSHNGVYVLPPSLVDGDLGAHYVASLSDRTVQPGPDASGTALQAGCPGRACGVARAREGRRPNASP